MSSSSPPRIALPSWSIAAHDGALDAARKRDLYRALLFPRLVEEKMLILLRQGRLSKWFSGMGQEAIAVGVTAALRPRDPILPLHRNLGVFTGRGLDLLTLFRQLLGRDGGYTGGRDRTFHFGTPAHQVIGMISHLGAMLPVADGLALAFQLRGEDRVAAVFSGDGGTSEGDFHEAVNLAAVWKLPVIVVVENNQYGLSTPISEQFACEALSDKGIGYGMAAETVDGNDLPAVVDAVGRAAARGRRGDGPTLLEFVTFRMRGHEEASGVAYIPTHLFEEWAAKDPIARYERQLIDEGVLTPGERDAVRAAFKAHIDAIADQAYESPEPDSTAERELADVYAPCRGALHAPRSDPHEPAGALHAPRSDPHEPAGALHAPRSDPHESAGALHAPRSDPHEPAGALQAPRSDPHESAGALHAPRSDPHESAGALQAPRLDPHEPADHPAAQGGDLRRGARSAPLQVKETRYIDAISDGLRTAMRADDRVILLGQDIAEYGGAFKVTEGFVEEFGKARVRNTPIIESGAIGAAMGLALEGFRPMVEMQFGDFISCGFNQIVNNLAKTHYRWGAGLPVVIRVPVGGGTGAGPFHSQNPEAWFTHVAGLKVVAPATPADAKGLLLAAFEDGNPVLYLEHKFLYRSARGPVPADAVTTPIGPARIACHGDALTVVSWGVGVSWALDAAATLEAEGVSLEVVDLRTLLPWDREAVLDSVRKTSRVVILHEAPETGGFGGEIAAVVAQEAFAWLDAPVTRVAGLDMPVPFSKRLEAIYSPQGRLVDAIRKVLGY
jgi:pyruvate/2-oxoglutarate/acetoin dehydrogenase E1 component/TPP-dependent pyruvate/acetoin dehydrogenase alpha subunit